VIGHAAPTWSCSGGRPRTALQGRPQGAIGRRLWRRPLDPLEPNSAERIPQGALHGYARWGRRDRATPVRTARVPAMVSRSMCSLRTVTPRTTATTGSR